MRKFPSYISLEYSSENVKSKKVLLYEFSREISYIVYRVA